MAQFNIFETQVTTDDGFDSLGLHMGSYLAGIAGSEPATEREPSSFKLEGWFDHTQVSGEGFVFDPADPEHGPVAGRIHAIDAGLQNEFDPFVGQGWIKVTGLDLAADQFMALVRGDKGPALRDLLLSGDDRVDGSFGDDLFSGGGGKDSLFGGHGKDTVFGGPGADLADGGAGNDLLKGQGGDDVLRGQEGGDRLFGVSGADQLSGGPGNDQLLGGEGRDTLTGGRGRDIFVFDTAPTGAGNLDRIEDFRAADDRIRLDDADFGGIGATGALGDARFHAGSSAATAQDRVLYDKATGRLWFDPDGTGAAAPVSFARLDAGAALTEADLFVI